jgi:hypothetical protein
MNGRGLFASVFVLVLIVSLCICLAAIPGANSAAGESFRILGIQPLGEEVPDHDGYMIWWRPAPDRTNTVEYSDSLSGPWQNLFDVPAGPNLNPIAVIDYPPTWTSQRLYRVRAPGSSLVMSLVLDRSGSMNVNGGSQILPPAVSAFIDLFNDLEDRAAMVSFSYAASTDVTMRRPFKNDIKNAADAMVFDGWTCAERGLTNALAQNSSVTAPPGEHLVKVIVFFTDGMANTWYYPNFNCGPRNIGPDASLYDPITGSRAQSGCIVPSTIPSIAGGVVNTSSCVAMNTEAQARAERIAALARSRGNYIFAIGMGDPNGPGECSGVFRALNPDFLKNLANTPDSQTYDPSQPSGDYAIAANANELLAVFQEIALKVSSQ